MKILLSNPPFFKNFNRQVRWSAKTSGALHPPVYLAYAAANLKKAGYDVLLVDAVALELTRDEFLERIEKFNPEIIVFETSTPSFLNDSELVDMIKSRIDAKVVFTGSHASALPEDNLRMSKLDFVCIGEYEGTLVELAEHLKNKKTLKNVKGLAYKDRNGEIRINKPRPLIEEIDKLPWPLREQLPTEKYRDTLLTAPFTFIVTARGCPYYCTYCNWPYTMFGHKIRPRGTKDVVDEVEHCIKKHKLKTYKFFDDTFTADRKHVIAICNELIKRGIKTPWICNARVDTLDEETMILMKKAGCYLYKVGVESGNQKILNWIRKGTTIQQIKKFFKTTKKVGMQTFASFMIGYPEETKETIKQTFDLAKEIEPDMVQFVILQPLPGTPLYSWMAEREMLPENIEWDKYLTSEGFVDIVFKHPKFSQEEMRQICSKLWKGYYLRPRYITKRIFMGLKSPREMKKNIHGIKKIFRY
ncbi:MAG: radical SAM protein [Candidatus Aenigmarchaeota archaeon]|nr:radical SAM protein [Candidatus Aenigmarchaeota archaeon]